MGFKPEECSFVEVQLENTMSTFEKSHTIKAKASPDLSKWSWRNDKSSVSQLGCSTCRDTMWCRGIEFSAHKHKHCNGKSPQPCCLNLFHSIPRTDYATRLWYDTHVAKHFFVYAQAWPTFIIPETRERLARRTWRGSWVIKKGPRCLHL